MERKILRKMYGPTCKYGYWRIKMKQEMYRNKGKGHYRKGHEDPEGE